MICQERPGNKTKFAPRILCDECGHPVVIDGKVAYLVNSSCVPEGSVYHLHSDCAPDFLKKKTWPQGNAWVFDDLEEWLTSLVRWAGFPTCSIRPFAGKT